MWAVADTEIVEKVATVIARRCGVGVICSARASERPNPGKSMAMTFRSASRRSSTGSQTQSSPPIPWIKTKGAPDPER